MLKIRSKYILKKIIENIKENKLLDIIKYNKIFQNKFNISIQNYIEYNQIEFQLKPIEFSRNDKFINIDIMNQPYIHIYSNNDKKEIDFCSLFMNKALKESSIFWPKMPEDLDNKELLANKKIILDFEVKSLKGLFKNCESLKEINIIKCNRKDIIDTSEMFYGCKNLDKLNIINLKTDNVKDMSYMFSGCLSLTEINVLNFNTSNVTNMQNMFEQCSKLKELNLCNFNTSNVIYMNDMFYECSSLRTLYFDKYRPLLLFCKKDLTYDDSTFKSKNNYWNTNNVINMSYMFYNCKSLEELNLSQFDTSKVIDMSYMFYKCSSLNELTFSNFNTSNAINMSNMFDGCKYLNFSNIPNFNLKNNPRIKYMFSNTKKEYQQKLKDKFNNINNNAFENLKDNESYGIFDDGPLFFSPNELFDSHSFYFENLSSKKTKIFNITKYY